MHDSKCDARRDNSAGSGDVAGFRALKVWCPHYTTQDGEHY